MNIEGLSLDQMKVALAVADAGSLSGAARRFNRTQSAVSYAVMSLERQLGVQLFDRSAQCARPTSAAGPLLREMKAILSRTDALRESARLLREGDSTTLVIGVDIHYPLAALTGAMAAFQNTFLSTGIEIRSAASHVVVDRVLDGLCILGIVTAPTKIPEPLVHEPLPMLPLIPVVSRGHSLYAGHPNVAGDVDWTRHIQVTIQGERLPAPLVTGQTQPKTWCVDDLTTKLAFLRAGLGWGYVPQHLVQEDLAQGGLEIIALPGLQAEYLQSVHLVRSGTRELALPARWLAHYLPHRSSGPWPVAPSDCRSKSGSQSYSD